MDPGEAVIKSTELGVVGWGESGFARERAFDLDLEGKVYFFQEQGNSKNKEKSQKLLGPLASVSVL